MVDTLPDYSSRGRNDVVSGVADMSEQACRLGSIVTFDRRGEIAWMDDFEHTANKWNLTGTGLGNSQSISATTARNGDSCLKLVCGSTATFDCEMTKAMQLPSQSGLGFEFSFTLATGLSYILLQSWIYDGNNYVFPQLKIDYANDTIYYRDSDGNYVDTGLDLTRYFAKALFNTIKIVLDYSTSKYLRVVYNNQSVDLSTESVQSAPAVTEPYMWLSIKTVGTNGNNPTIYIDDVIITDNEG